MSIRPGPPIAIQAAPTVTKRGTPALPLSNPDVGAHRFRPDRADQSQKRCAAGKTPPYSYASRMIRPGSRGAIEVVSPLQSGGNGGIVRQFQPYVFRFALVPGDNRFPISGTQMGCYSFPLLLIAGLIQESPATFYGFSPLFCFIFSRKLEIQKSTWKFQFQ